MDDGAGQTDVEAAPAPASAPVSPIHSGDLVAFKSKGEHGDRGVVLDMVGDDMPEDNDKLAVLCVGGAVVYVEQGDLTVVDRSALNRGEMVVSASDPGGQVGVVMGVDTVVDLEAGGEVVARGVSPGELRRVTELCLGDYVASGPWLGRVVELSVDVDVAFGDGAVCRVTAADEKVIVDSEWPVEITRDYCNGLHYPGKRVVGATDSVFKAARWLNGNWKRTRDEGTISRVELGAVLVHWVASAQLGTEEYLVQASAPPPHQRNPRDLTFFRSDDDFSWGVADRCFFREPRRHGPRATIVTAADDNVAAPSDSEHLNLPGAMVAPTDTSGGSSSPPSPTPALEQKKLHLRKTFFKRDKRARRGGGRRIATFERPMFVADTRTTVDVLWQDGTRQRGVPSASLADFDTHVNEFVPGQRVIRLAPPAGGAAAGPDDDGDEQGSAATEKKKDDSVAHADDAAARVGVVRSVNCKEHTARVAWLKAAPRGEEPSEVEGEETVSTYDLDENHDHCVFYGDVVVRRLPSESGGGDSGGIGTEAAAAAGEDLSWVGQVVDFCDAYIQVQWGDGNTSKVLPHEVEVVDEPSVSAMRQAMGDWVDAEDADEEAEEEDKREEPAATADEARIQHQGDGSADESAGGEDSATAAKTTAGRVVAFIHALIQLPGEALARGKKYFVGESTTTASVTLSSSVPAAMEVNGEEASSGDGHETAGSVAVPASGGDGGVDGDDDSAEEEEEEEAPSDVASGGGDDSFHFTQFDVVQSPPDHHFLDDAEQRTAAAKEWTKRVQKEWKILKNNLPDTIYVRAFEDRMDLLRAAMVGAAGTPYQDCLFLFDVQLPPSYPSVPPQVYYHSFGLRVNPNLDNSGTVCLSLLDTFDGEDSERWSPATSSILQVLVSIQGLVLIAQPYYSESVYEHQLGRPEGARNALPYAENAYLHTLRTVLHLLRRPPSGFEELVRGHFRRRGRLVLRACEAYLQGCPVGALDADACATEETGERPCSAGLRLALNGVVPRLVEAFTEIGADGCEQLDRLQASFGGAAAGSLASSN